MRILSLQLATSHLPAMRQFYGETLGCSTYPVEGGFGIDAGNTQLIFLEANKGNPLYHFAFTIPFHDVGEIARLTSQKVPLLETDSGNHIADFTNWNAQAFYFLDPAGNIVECIGREPINQAGSGAFLSKKILISISEIGIVTDEVLLTCRQLAALWQVPFFIKQPPAPKFAAAGTDEGLFIVVQEGRPWFPTQTKAVKAPVKLVFQTGDGLTRTLELG